MRRPEALNKIVSVIRSVAPHARVILFGSEARGEARQDSDFDILILEDTDRLTYERRKEITYPLYQLFFDFGINVQPIVKTQKEWDNYPHPSLFHANILTDGILL